MFSNYLKTALRIIRQSPVYSLINILGLAAGLTCTILILLYVNREFSFDRFHANIDRLYRLKMTMIMPDQVQDGAVTNLVMGPAIRENIPEVSASLRLLDMGGMVSYEGKAFHDIKGFFADSNFFQVFSFELLQGEPGKVLSELSGGVITRDLALKAFGNEDPVGKIMLWNQQIDFMVTGVMDDPPDNSQLEFDLILPMEQYIRTFKPYLEWDGGFSNYTYLLLEEGVPPSVVEEKFPEFMYDRVNRKIEEYGARLDLSLYPVKKIHLHADYQWELGRTNTFRRTMIFAGIALLILFSAAFNYMNLTTARASRRSREIGIRKASGATRGKLITQFSGESVLFSLLAGIFALALVELLLPSFNALAGTEVRLSDLSVWKLCAGLPVFVLLLGIISSTYPALYLSAIDPVRPLKGMTESKTGRPVFRNILVTLQFALSVALILSTGFIYLQVNFLQKKELGYDRENLLVIPVVNREMEQKLGLLKERMNNLPEVTGAGLSSGIPGFGLTQNGYVAEGYDRPMMFHALDIDEDFISVMKIEMATGRNFSSDMATDDTKMLINETLARQLGWDEPIGKTIFRDTTFTVIGVVKDFHYSRVQEKIRPLVITLNKNYRRQNMVVRLQNAEPQTVRSVESAFHEIFPEHSFMFHFLDKRLEYMFRSEQQFAKLILTSTFIAIFIASLGLFALGTYSAERRTREIGIRKAMGASAPQVVMLFMGEFTWKVMAANLLAYPVVWIFITRWLNNYEYRIGLSAWVFLAGTLLSFLLTLLTVGYQAWRSSLINPAETLKYE